MEKILSILCGIKPDIDFTTCKALIDDSILDSYDIISIVNEFEEAFEIVIPATEITPENLNSAEALWNMVQRLIEK
jgi:D-alanine--poly(phosphoribitol) ligase subunit 2